VSLWPLDGGSLRAEAAGRQALAAKLGVAETKQWPPPLDDENLERWLREQLEGDPGIAGCCGIPF